MMFLRAWLRVELPRRWRSLAVLALGAVGHALATAVRRRSHDLAVLRALGMTQRQCRMVVITQATVLALLLVAPVVVVLANLLAARPGHRAARLRIAHVLRTE